MNPSFPAWALAVLLLPSTMAEDSEEDDGEALNVTMVFNFQTVRVTWEAGEDNLTFIYRYEGPVEEPEQMCPLYLLRGGFVHGCILDGQQEVLHFSIRNGTHSLANHSWYVGHHLTPEPPLAVSVSWGEDAAVVSCQTLPHAGLRYQVQYRSSFDVHWQSREARSCEVPIDGLDARKCYEIRVRLLPVAAFYGLAASPSRWSHVSRWRAARPTASCDDAPQTPSLLLTSALVALAALMLLLASFWKLPRIKSVLVPCVPDPRCTFPGLFEKHHGNFQDWIAEAELVIPEGCPEEEVPVVHVSHSEPEPPSTRTPVAPEEEARKLPDPPPTWGDGDAVSPWVVGEDCYVTP